MIIRLLNRAQNLLDATRRADWLGPLALRLYLVPVFWVAGINKYNGFENTVAWFGNADWGLGLPFPLVLAFLAVATEIGGAAALAIGFATRWATIPLIVQMVVAATKVHWDNGWQFVADPMIQFPPADIEGTMERLTVAKQILRQQGDYGWLTENGNFAIVNGGIEWAATYLVMLLALLFIGGGRFVSVDYWLARRFRSAG
jgi:putative oxidoreductase